MTGGIRPGPLGSGAIVLFALGLAASALAATLTQVTADAEALLIVYEDL